MTTELTNAGSPAFVPVGVLETTCNKPAHVVRANVATNMQRDVLRLHKMPSYGKFKGRPLAIVAGGPSLNLTLDELRAFECVMVCGSAHDALMRHGFVPDYAALCDADPIELDFLQLADHRTVYLVASMCDPSVFDHLDGHRTLMWHAFQGDAKMFGDELPHAIQGGSTVTLRAISLAIMMGFSDLHFFGLDSSFEDREYAYEGNPESTEPIIEAKVGNRIFKTTPGWLAQATHFREMAINMAHFFKPTVHGDGLIAAMLKPGEDA